MLRTKGFTLIELMITVAIIGTLAAIMIPRMADALRASKEAGTKGNLGAIRSALSIYYSDTEGVTPSDDLTCLLSGSKYLESMPLAYREPWHPALSAVLAGSGAIEGQPNTYGWMFWDVPGESSFGRVTVNCNHNDLKGEIWTSL